MKAPIHRPFLFGDPRQPKFLVDKDEIEDNTMIKSPPAFISNPTILATTPKTSIDAETTRQTTVKAITLVDFGQKQPLVELSTKKPETLKEPGTTVEALTKSPPRQPSPLPAVR